MEKRKEIPAEKPNAAAKADVERVRERIDRLEIDFHDAVKRAGFSKPTGYRLLNAEASVGTLRELEEWVVKEERRRKQPPQPTSEEIDARLVEWNDLGRELMQLEPQQFDASLDGLRDLVQSIKLRDRAITKMFRATPGADR